MPETLRKRVSNLGERQELATKYGVTYSADWVADLASRHGLKLLGH